MKTDLTENTKQVAALIHLSTFSKYIFPFGNFLAPLLLWTVNKERPFVNEHGRQAINFQLSIFLYTLLIGIACLPFFAVFATDFVDLVEIIDNHVHRVSINNIRNFSGFMILFLLVALLLLGLFVFELYAVINASIKAHRGEYYKYPITISFIKPASQGQESTNQSKNEHSS